MAGVIRWLALASLAWSSPAGAQTVELDIPMTDGVTLKATAYGVSATAATRPMILIRTPYGRVLQSIVAVVLSVQSQAVVVVQDTRGQGGSGGVDRGFVHSAQDGVDTLNWLAANGYGSTHQSSYGASALAINQILMTPGAPAGYACQFVIVGSSLLAEEGLYSGGVRRVELDTWAERQGLGSMIAEWNAHPDPNDAYWDPVTLDAEEVARADVVGAHVAGWFDIFLIGSLDWFSKLQTEGAEGSRGRQRIMIGPWTHGGGMGDLAFPDADRDELRNALRSDWASDCVREKDTSLQDRPPVRLYVIGAAGEEGSAGNEWRDYDEWPVPGAAPVDLYLRGGGGLAVTRETEAAATSTWAHDPLDPVPNVGGNNLTVAAGPLDQRDDVESRADVAVFTTDALGAPAELIGALHAELWVTLPAEVVHVVVRITDVYPDGRSMLMRTAVKRVEGQGDGPQRVDIPIWPIAWAINTGHRLRVTVSGAASGAFADSTVAYTGTLHHDASRPSRLVLPVMYGLSNPTSPGADEGTVTEADDVTTDARASDTGPAAVDTSGPDDTMAPATDTEGDTLGVEQPVEGGGSGGGCADCASAPTGAPWLWLGLLWVAAALARRRRWLAK